MTNYVNDYNTTISSSSLSVVAVTVAVALPWIRCVQYLFGYDMPLGATNYTNDNNTSTPSSSLAAVAIAVANPLIRHKYST